MAHEFKSGTIFAAKGMDSYAAYPLCDGNGFQLGLLVAMDRRPMPDAALAEAVLKIIGSRIAVELERASADAVLRTAALAVSNARGASVFTELGALPRDDPARRDGVRREAACRSSRRCCRSSRCSSTASRSTSGATTMQGTPCEVVLNEGFKAYTADVAELFPTDAALLEHELVAYAGHPLHDLDGKPVGILAIASRQPLWHPERIESMMQIFAVRAGAEIERLRSEEALRGSEESYRTIFEASEDGVVIHDWHSGALVDLNPKACEMSGFRREEVLGAPMTAFCTRAPPFSEADAQPQPRARAAGPLPAVRMAAPQPRRQPALGRGAAEAGDDRRRAAHPLVQPRHHREEGRRGGAAPARGAVPRDLRGLVRRVRAARREPRGRRRQPGVPAPLRLHARAAEGARRLPRDLPDRLCRRAARAHRARAEGRGVARRDGRAAPRRQPLRRRPARDPGRLPRPAARALGGARHHRAARPRARAAAQRGAPAGDRRGRVRLHHRDGRRRPHHRVQRRRRARVRAPPRRRARPRCSPT